MLATLVDACVRHRLVVLALALGLFGYGVHAYLGTPVEAFPDVTNLQVNVITSMSGMAPPEVERQVTIPIERALNGTPGLVGLRSESLFGLSLVYLVFDDDVDAFRARTVVEQRLRTAELPEGVSPRLGPEATPLGEIFHFRLTSKGHSLPELRSEIEWNVAPRLRRVPGVADVVGRGGYLEEIHVEVDPARLDAARLTLDDVRDALDDASLNAGGGFMTSGEQQLVVRGVGQLVDPTDIATISLGAEDGIPITIADVARVYRSHVPRQGAAAYGEADESVEAAVFMRRGENPSVVLDALHAAIDELGESGLPRGMQIVPFYDRSALVSRTLATVHRNLLEGALLCIGIVWLFLRTVRGSLVVAIVIPLSLLVAFIGLYAIGLPANLISMGAIDFGILVDGAVILVENVMHRLQHTEASTHEQRRALVADAARDVARPIFFAMAIIIAALVPIFSLERVEGRIFRPLALTYTFALLGALVLSLTLVPALASMALRAEDVAHEEPRLLVRLRAWHTRALGGLLHRGAVLVVALGVFLAGTWATAGTLGTEFLPELDEGDFTVFVELPTSASLETAEQTLREVRTRLLRYPEVREVATKLGRPEDGTDNESVNMSETYVHLAEASAWRASMTKDALLEDMRRSLEALPGIRFNFSQPIRDNVEESISGVRGKVVLKIFGTDLEVMRETLLRSLDVVRRVPGVIEASLYRDRSVPQLEVRPDRRAIARLGLSMGTVQRTLETAVAGSAVGEIWSGERVVPIRLRLPYPDREDATRVGDVLVANEARTRVPLREIASIDVRPGRASINREAGSRALSLKFNVAGRDAGSVVRDAIEAVDRDIRLPDGYRFAWGGEFENQARAMKRLSVVVPLALAAVVALLAMALRSARSALSVVVVVPIAVAGGVFALAFTGIHVSVSAAIGFIALMGQVALAALLVVGAIDERIARGVDLARAGVAGATSQLRPVLMTSLLAMLGLFPMAASSAPGSETQRPFAVVMVGGMVTTCLAVLVVLPCVQVAMVRTTDALARRWRRS